MTEEKSIDIVYNRDPLTKLFNYFRDKNEELKKIFTYLNFSKPKIISLLKRKQEIRQIDKDLFIYLLYNRFVKSYNIFWEKKWKLFKFHEKENIEKIINVEKIGYSKIKNTNYKWIKIQNPKDIIFLFNEENLKLNIKISKLLDSLIMIIEPSQKLLMLAENNNQPQNFIKFFQKKQIEIYSYTIPSYILKDYLWKTKNIIRASLTCRKEISGTDGITQINFLGYDVARGISELNNRQEIDLSKLGTWMEIESSDFQVDVNGNIRFKELIILNDFINSIKNDLIETKVF